MAAVERLRSASNSTSSRHHVPSRKKRDGGIAEEVKAAVILWWTEQTRVSPRRRDVQRKRLERSLYDTHAAHLLLEGQVCVSFPFSVPCTSDKCFIFTSSCMFIMVSFSALYYA